MAGLGLSQIGLGLRSRASSGPTLKWRAPWSTFALGAYASALPAGLAFTRASTQLLRQDSGGGCVYASGTASNDAPVIGTIGGVTGLLLDGGGANLLATKTRGSDVATSPWTVGSPTAATLSAGAGVDGLASAAASMVCTSGNYSNYDTVTPTIFGLSVIAYAHAKPSTGGIQWQVRANDGNLHYAAGTLTSGVWQMIAAPAFIASNNSLQWAPCIGADGSASGGVTARDLGPYLVDFHGSVANTHLPLTHHPTTLAAPQFAQADTTQSIFGGSLIFQCDISFPYALSAMRWDNVLWTLHGDAAGTYVKIDAAKQRIKVSVGGVEVVLPTLISTIWQATTDVLRFYVRAGNGVPIVTCARSTDRGATFGAAVSLGTSAVVQPPIVAGPLALHYGCDALTSTFEAVHLDWQVLGAGSTAVPGADVFAAPTAQGAGTGMTAGNEKALPAAIAAARALLAAGHYPVRVQMRGNAGTYFFPTLFGSALALAATDAGLRFVAYPGESPEWSGATPIAGGAWSVWSGSVYQATVAAGTRVPHFTVNGTKAKMAGDVATITPIAGWTVANPSAQTLTLTAPDSTIAGYHSPTDVVLRGDTNNWKSFLLTLSAALGTTITATASSQSAAVFQGGSVMAAVTAVCNARELCASPGDFAYESAGTVYYYPRVGDTMATADARLPTLDTLVTMIGTRGAPVTDILFSGITVSDTGASSQLTNGWSPLQASVQGSGVQFVSETYSALPGAVSLKYARSITFGGCTFTRLGAVGLRLDTGTQGLVCAGTSFLTIGGAAATAGWIDQAAQRPSDGRDIVSNNLFVGCTIDGFGRVFHGSCAAEGYFVAGLTFSQCTARNGYYSAFSIGWGWQYAESGGYNGHGFPTDQAPASGDTICANNAVTNCSIESTVNTLLTEGAAIYLVGNQPGTTVSGNRCAGSGNSIYIDNGGAHIRCEGNVIATGVCQTAAPIAHDNIWVGNFYVGNGGSMFSSTPDASNTITGNTLGITGAGALAVIAGAGR